MTLPQIRFAVISGPVLAFFTSFDGVVVALFVSGGENSTLTRTMFDALRDQIDPTIAAISTVMVLSHLPRCSGWRKRLVGGRLSSSAPRLRSDQLASASADVNLEPQR